MTRHALSLLVGLILAVTLPAAAETHRVDDSATQVLGTTLRLKPTAPLARGSQASIVSGDVSVIVRLAVAPWKGRQGRIYMILPGQPEGAITATWNTRGRLMPGVLRAGERTLVYEGLVQDDMIEDTLRLNIRADERTLPRDQQLAFAFEIDLDTP